MIVGRYILTVIDKIIAQILFMLIKCKPWPLKRNVYFLNLSRHEVNIKHPSLTMSGQRNKSVRIKFEDAKIIY